MNFLPLFRNTVFAALVAGTALTACAVMADPEPRTVTQPDGSKVTLQLFGDEFFSYTLTRDGYQVVFNPLNKTWEFAALAPDRSVVPGGIVAANGKRPLAMAKGPLALPTAEQAGMRKARRKILEPGAYDYSKFHGLIILVEFNDAPFTRSDIHQIFSEMVNKKGYDGFMSDNLIPSKIEYTGSVRDYYYDNSNGIFDPSFDVVGPVKVNYSQFYARQTSGAQTLVKAALNALDDDIDYSLYDTDGNREVDMVYFIFSGAGSNFSGNDSNLIWPHASSVMGLSLDGVSFGRYACSTELYGAPANKELDGIGTICHEFSHVLGLPDLYDVDYETNGQAENPGKWSLMAAGSYLNRSRTPCGYSLWERYYLGFTEPRLISETGKYSLRPVNEGDTPDGCRINSSVDEEYFMLEARDKTGWDAYLPGQGLLVHRVDYSNPSVWTGNRVNETPQHTYYTLLRADAQRSGSTVTDGPGDPFPGTGNVTSLTNATTPSMRSWASISSPLVLGDITRADDGAVSFTVTKDDVPTLVEEFDLMDATADDATGVKGRFASWDFSKGALIEKTDSAAVSSLTTVKGSEIQCTPVDATVENVAVTINNLSRSSAVFRLYRSTDGGTSWHPVNSVEGTANPSVKGLATATIRYNTGKLEKPALRLEQFTGSTTGRCTIARIELGITPGSQSAVTDITADTAPAAGDGTERWYNLQGAQVTDHAAPGIYIRVSGTEARKVMVR